MTIPYPRRRRSIRLKGYDYTSEGGYFITLVAHERQSIFGEIIDGEMRLNALGVIARDEWFRTALMRPYVELFDDEFVVMPNHIHGIIWITNQPDRWGTARRAPTDDLQRRAPTDDLQRRAPIDDPTPNLEQFGKPVSGSIPTIVRSYKSVVTKNINELRGAPSNPIWQRNYYEHIITTDREYESIVEYIDANPCAWLNDSENPLQIH